MDHGRLTAAQAVAPVPIKLFLSHAHHDKLLVQETADELILLGISPFVANRNIHPSSEWLRRLERELAETDGVVAFLSPSFRPSAWADQEVGYALGRGKAVLPVQLADSSSPHGFIERYQAVTAIGMDPHEIAVRIVDWLVTRGPLNQKALDLIISRLEHERSSVQIRFWVQRLNQVDKLSLQFTEMITRLLETNPVIKTDPALRAEIEQVVERNSR